MRVTVVSIAAASCLIAESASGHAHLDKVNPADGSSLMAAPAALEMTFSEPARMTALWIQKDQEPKQAVKDLPTATARTLRVALPVLAPGVYAVSWRVLSADGHIMSGGSHFTILPRAP